VSQGEQAFEQKGPLQGGLFLGRVKKSFKRKSRKDLSQVKRLKELKVARLAARQSDMAETSLHTQQNRFCHICIS
jgi:hypothetical protein